MTQIPATDHRCAVRPEQAAHRAVALGPGLAAEHHLRVADVSLGLCAQDAGYIVDLADQRRSVRTELGVAMGEEVLPPATAAGLARLLVVFGI